MHRLGDEPHVSYSLGIAAAASLHLPEITYTKTFNISHKFRGLGFPEGRAVAS